jgi:hypothetical protein
MAEDAREIELLVPIYVAPDKMPRDEHTRLVDDKDDSAKWFETLSNISAFFVLVSLALVIIAPVLLAFWGML